MDFACGPDVGIIGTLCPFSFRLYSLIAIALAVVALAASLVYLARARYLRIDPAVVAGAGCRATGRCAYGLEVASTDPASKLFWAKAQWFGLTLAPVLWLATAARGTSDWPTILGGRRWLLWLLIPALIMILVLTNDWHGLVWSKPVLAHNDSTLPLRLERGRSSG